VKNEFRFSVGNSEVKRQLMKPGSSRKDTIRNNLKEHECEALN
jgi:hypothetical protein